MQEARFSSPMMGNDWTEPELDLQPHASDMHGALGGARISSIDIGTYQAPSGSVTDGFEQDGTKILDRCACPYPGCYAIFDTQWKLDTHAQVHFSNATPYHSGSIGFEGDLNHPGTFPYDPLGINYHNMYWSPTPGAAPAFFGIQEQTYPSTTMPFYDNFALHDNNVMTNNPSAPLPGDGEPPLPAMSDGRFACAVCGKTCTRRGDLRRHELKHMPGTKVFDCPKPDCVRKGLQGFDRKDKMISHMKVCQGGVGGSIGFDGFSRLWDAFG
ncbi:MAG: hypothetical protein Q9188_002880 [Gyalolechia gomerana]